jgi:hypothetical protein
MAHHHHQQQQPQSQQQQHQPQHPPPHVPSQTKISFGAFYGEFHGHRLQHLERLYPPIRDAAESIIWMAGDSSLDNKYWLSDRRPAQPAIGAYQTVLQPPYSKPDVTYWMNYLCHTDPTGQRQRIATMNTAGTYSLTPKNGKGNGAYSKSERKTTSQPYPPSRTVPV